MLKKIKHSKSGKMVWALVSVSKPGKVLEYYGAKKPGPGTVKKSEARVKYYKGK
jgi:hypothetical protein